MAKDRAGDPEKAGKIHRPTVRAVSRSSGQVNVRLIQSSPDANPKLVEVARQLAREFKEKHGEVEEHLDHIPEAPLVLPDQK
jgi:hypothetical protein